jgi:hypothetical protein
MSVKEKNVKTTDKSTNENAKSSAKWYHHWFFQGLAFGILGIGLTLVVASIIFSSVRMYLGTTDTFSHYAIVPQVTFAALAILYAFFVTVKALLKK